MRRLFLHLPRFPVQRKVRETPSLMGAPIALAEEQRGARRVVFASGAAQKEGVRVGMTLTAAQALLPSLHVFSYDQKAEEAALLSLGEALLTLAPSFELYPPEGIFLDASAAPLCKGEDAAEENLCRTVLELCAEHGYRGKAVVASQPFVAKALARHGTQPTEVVGPFEAAEAIASLPLLALSEVEPGIAEAVSGLGLSTLGEVAGLPAGAVVARLGASGLRAHALCRGIDDTPHRPTPLPEQIVERIELDWPAESMEPLAFALKTVLDRVCGRLSGRGLAAVRLLCALKLDPSGEHSLPLQLSRPTTQSKLLLELLRHRLADIQLENPIAQVRITVAEAQKDEGQQLSLGDGPQGDAALEIVLSRLATTLGEDALFSAELRPQHRPEGAYTPKSFRPPERAKGLLSEVIPEARDGQARLELGTSRKQKASHPPSEPVGWKELELAFGQSVERPGRPDLQPEPEGLSPPEQAAAAARVERPLRLFATPAQLEVDLLESGQVASARISGKRRRALAVAGPERLCGDWWEAESFARDYFRVHFEGMGPVWIFKDERDGKFYLQGMFD